MSSASPLANWNGKIMPLDEVMVSVLDRAFLFGDAVYEALRVYSGKPWLLKEHQARLARSLREVMIPADVDRIERRILETLSLSGTKEGLVYIQVTRGQGPRSHAWKKPMTPNELIYVQDYGEDPFKDLRPKGIPVVLQPDRRWGRCDVKSVNLLANSMACQAAYEAGCIEAILWDEREDIITEATHSSLFGVIDGVIRTAPNGPWILPGVTRDWIVEAIAREGLPIEERPIKRSELSRAIELFLTGTTVEVMPIIKVDENSVGDGKPGPIAVKLQRIYREAIDKSLA